jgi:glucan phosphoethanolaminetransferase (alkaline phosphatase superfamily)
MPSKAIIYMAFNASKTEIVAFTSGFWLWKFLIIALPVLVFLISYYKLPGKIILAKKIILNYSIILVGLFIFTFFFKATQRNSFKNGIQVTFRFFVKDTPVQFTIRTCKVIKQMRKEHSIQSYNGNGVNIKTRKSSQQQKINIPRTEE